MKLIDALLLSVLPLAGIAVGMLLVAAVDWWHWRRIWRRLLPQPVVNTAPPTLTELNRPDWMEDA